MFFVCAEIVFAAITELKCQRLLTRVMFQCHIDEICILHCAGKEMAASFDSTMTFGEEHAPRGMLRYVDFLYCLIRYSTVSISGIRWLWRRT